MKRLIALATVAGMTVVGVVAGPVHAQVPGPNGQIVFVQFDSSSGQEAVYLIDPDGTNPSRLTPWEAEFLQPRWSPDGTEISLSADACGTIGQQDCSDAIVNPDTGDFRLLPVPDPAFECTDDECGFGCFIWSPDGSRVACFGTSSTDPSKDGIYTVRASDGGDVRLVTHYPPNGFFENDFPVPKDFSPDGKRLVYVQVRTKKPSGLFVINLDGTGNHRITPDGLVWNHDEEASWSPTGDWIVFTANANARRRRAVFAVRANGTGFHQVPIPDCGGKYATPGSVGCGNASWSPDGTRIIYQRVEPNGQGTYRVRILTVKPDGTDSVAVTHRWQVPVFPDWGPHPLEG